MNPNDAHHIPPDEQALIQRLQNAPQPRLSSRAYDRIHQMMLAEFPTSSVIPPAHRPRPVAQVVLMLAGLLIITTTIIIMIIMADAGDMPDKATTPVIITSTSSATPSASATSTSSATSSASATSTSSATPSASATSTSSATPSASATWTSSATPSASATSTSSATPSASATSTSSATPSASATWTSSATPTPIIPQTPTPVWDLCVPITHPVANAIARRYAVDALMVITHHCMGYGFGELARAYEWVYGLRRADDVLAILRQARADGWGEMMREARPTRPATPADDNRGNGNDNRGNGNDNRGNGNDNRGNGNDNRGNGNDNRGNGGGGRGRGNNP